MSVTRDTVGELQNALGSTNIAVGRSASLWAAKSQVCKQDVFAASSIMSLTGNGKTVSDDLMIVLRIEYVNAVD